MEFLFEWLNSAFAGMIIGLFPLMWCSAGDISYANEFQNKKVPQWIVTIAVANPIVSMFYILFHNKSYYRKILRLVSGVWSVGYLIFFHFMLIPPILEEPHTLIWIEILKTELGFTLFLLLIWLLPLPFIKRYLRNLPEKDI